MNKKNDIFYMNSKKIASIILKKNELLDNHALLMIKPEAICSNKIETIISFLNNNSFKIIFYKFTNIYNAQMVALWQHSWCKITIERIFLNQKIFEKTSSLILILKYEGDKEVIASEYITYLKGSAHSHLRQSFTLRSILCPINYLINYIHTSDNVNDFTREMGVLFSDDELVQVFRIINGENYYNNTLDELFYQANLITKHSEIFDSNLYMGKLDDKFVHFIHDLKHKAIKNDYFDIIEQLDIALDKHLINFKLIISLLDRNLIKLDDWNTLIILSAFIPYNDN